METDMGIGNVFMTSTTEDSPLDSSRTDPNESLVSDFLTVQSLTNFAVMTGAITTAWLALQKLEPSAVTHWVPFWFAVAWAVISILMSHEVLLKDGLPKCVPRILAAVFVAGINALVLFSAVLGIETAAR